MEDFNWPLMGNAIGQEEIQAILDFLKDSPKFTKGKKVSEFESLWSKWQNCKYSVFVNSGSSANLILIDALKELYNWKKCDKIIVPTITWVTNISPILQLGLEPVFVDINLKNFSFDLEKLESTINSSENVVAVFITHLLGFPAEMDKIKSICYNKNIKLIEDCCESHGAKFNGIKVGNFGEAGSFSFYFGHHITTIEGGMVCTNDEKLHNLLLLKRSHGLARELPKEYFDLEKLKYSLIEPSFLFLTTGYNVRNHEIPAVIGIEQLKKIDRIIEKRNANFKIYHEIIKKYKSLLYSFQEEGVSSFSFPIIFKEKSHLNYFKKLLNQEKIEFRPIVSGNLLEQPFLSKYKSSLSDTPNSSIVHNNGVYIGNHQFINIEEIHKLDLLLNKLKQEYNFWKGKKVLVTGAGGFIGSYVSEILVDKGAEVFALLKSEGSNHSFLKNIKHKINIVYGDLKNFERCNELVKNKDIVLQLAAKVGGVGFNSLHPAYLYRENTQGFMNILEASRLENVERFLTVSSACVYPRECTIPTPEEEGFKELPEITNEGYGLAKRMQEKLSMYYAKEYGMKIAIARPYNAYGPRDDFNSETSHVIPALIKRVLDGENPFIIWGSGEQSRAFLYAKDFAEGILEVCEKYPNADPVNIGANEEIKIKDLVKLILEITGKNPKIKFDTTKPEGQPRRNCDTAKCEKLINWKSKTSLREGLENTINWYLKNL
jgi:dTDP-4-amino-4,6-dideoxygalactose transaminase/nucleoside-diphosphate-sugar epimerase